MDISFRIISFIKHWLTAGNAHGLHSPFVFDLYCEEISIDKKYYNFNTIESLKNNLLIDNREINLTELGSGIHGKNLKKSKIRNITSSSVCNQYSGISAS